jgi:hypothetical protein
MIRLLKERGYAIKCRDSEKIKELEEAIAQYTEKHYETDIVGVFVMFENLHQVKNAIDTCLADRACHAHRSNMPSDYKWENLAIPKVVREKNRKRANLWLFLILMIAYYYQYKMQAAVATYDVYEQMDCGLYSDAKSGATPIVTP